MTDGMFLIFVHDIETVLEIMRQLVHLGVFEAGLIQHVRRKFFSRHAAEAVF